VSEDQDIVPEPEGNRFPELEDLQKEIDKRLRDNRRFLEKFMDDAFEEEEESEEEEDGDEFEEL
jgi:hypothetical protein